MDNFIELDVTSIEKPCTISYITNEKIIVNTNHISYINVEKNKVYMKNIRENVVFGITSKSMDELVSLVKRM